MAIPTRLIEQEEFQELLAVEEGDTIPIFKLTAFPFNPPLPDGEGWPEHEHPRAPAAVRVMLLPVVEPRLYRDPNKNMFVVFPSFETMEYEDAQDMHPMTGAWCYRLTPYHWDESSSPLKDATYLFRDEWVNPFDADDPETH